MIGGWYFKDTTLDIPEASAKFLQPCVSQVVNDAQIESMLDGYEFMKINRISMKVFLDPYRLDALARREFNWMYVLFNPIKDDIPLGFKDLFAGELPKVANWLQDPNTRVFQIKLNNLQLTTEESQNPVKYLTGFPMRSQKKPFFTLYTQPRFQKELSLVKCNDTTAITVKQFIRPPWLQLNEIYDKNQEEKKWIKDPQMYCGHVRLYFPNATEQLVDQEEFYVQFKTYMQFKGKLFYRT